MEIQRNPALDETLVDALVDVWVAVANAGGAVGFVPPVHATDVRPIADAALARVRDGLDDLAVAFDDGRVVGSGFLATNPLRIHGHWATVRRLQRHPAVRGRGIGAALLAALEAAARDRGLDHVVLSVRGGTGRERYYLDRGYAIQASLPGRIHLGDGDFRDELVLAKPLRVLGAPGPTLGVRRLDPELPLPAYAHADDAGLDLYARVDVTLRPGERAIVSTGVAVALPPGCVGLVHPRSGLAARHGVGLVNAPGTIDAGYRGEISVVLVNHDRRETVTLTRGDRVAQLLIQRVETVRVVEVDALDDTRRGAGGFGSSGR